MLPAVVVGAILWQFGVAYLAHVATKLYYERRSSIHAHMQQQMRRRHRSYGWTDPERTQWH